jgi:hypothetical protein
MAGNFPIHGGNHCLYFNGSGTIRRNIIANCSPVAHNGQGIGTHSTNGFPTTVDVSGNDVWGTGFSAIEAAEATGMLIYNNVVHDLGSTNGNDCWGVCDAIHVYTGVNTFIANNTIYNITNSGRPGIDTVLPAIAMIGGSSGTTVQNNIIYGGTNNTISASDGGTISNNRCDSGCTTAANPQFTNAAGGNFHLTASSPTTITQGGVPLASSFTTDKDGVAWGSTWGMGAYKYVVSGLSFPTVSDFPSVACCLDNFNRANGALGANWANALSPPFTIVSSRAVAPSGYSRMLWSAATFGGYHEAYAEFPTPPNTADVLLIFAGKESGNNNQWRLYAYNYYGPTWQIDVQSADAVGALTQRVALVDLGVATLPNNTSWGVRVSAGPTLTVYWKYTDGLWYRISQTTQATLPTGPVWIGISGIAPTTVENFGGGTCCSATPKSPTGLNLTWLWRR